MSKQPFYITTAISYVNGAPHLGHAYEQILTDVMARFQRLDGKDVMFLTGTDEHGEKVAQTAEKNDMTPIAFADKNAALFRELTGTLNISNDDFIRTTEERHYAAAQAIWKKLEEKGHIYLGEYAGWYSTREEAFFTEDELIDDPASGEKITPNGTPVHWVEESSYFFKLSEYTDILLKYYEDNPKFIQPETRRNEVIAFVKQGLKDLSISRHKDRLHWGIPVPGDDNHVMYVWLDALTNYITAPGYPDESAESYQKYWPVAYHVIGKDIIRFHTIYWPAFLMSAGVELPKTVFAHGFINVEGVKMSKSLGNVLSPDNLVATYGLDALRYLLMREIVHGQDGNFSHDHAVQRINADLANGLGNLAQRTLSMIYKNCDGAYPEPNEYTDDDKALLKAAQEDLRPKMQAAMKDFAVHKMLEAVMDVARAADGYVDAQAPWTLKKEDPERMKTVLYVLAETIRCLAIAVQPVVPDSAGKMLDQLKAEQRDYAAMSADHALTPGTAIDKPEGVFPRIEAQSEEEAA